MTGPTFKTVSQCYFEQCPSSRGTGKEEPPGALYAQGQTKLRLGRRAGVAERTRLPRIPFASPQYQRDEEGPILWVCPVYVSCFAQSDRIMTTMV